MGSAEMPGGFDCIYGHFWRIASLELSVSQPSLHPKVEHSLSYSQWGVALLIRM